ncbi:hypothetical protein Misp03_51810 [Microbispora sp. NBRC 16548]|nr:hypothetical protein Misp03_51810 [Microbispora sp. NBRC 16548]
MVLFTGCSCSRARRDGSGGQVVRAFEEFPIGEDRSGTDEGDHATTSGDLGRCPLPGRSTGFDHCSGSFLGYDPLSFTHGLLEARQV